MQVRFSSVLRQQHGRDQFAFAKELKFGEGLGKMKSVVNLSWFSKQADKLSSIQMMKSPPY